MHVSAPLRLALPLLALSLGTGLSSAHPPPTDAEALRRLNREMLEDLIVRNDPSTFNAHAHESFVVVAPGGRVEDKAQAAAGAQAFDAAGITISGERISTAGDTVVVVGRLDIDGVMRPVGKPGPMKFMSIFVRTDGAWKLLSRSLTPCHAIAVERGAC